MGKTFRNGWTSPAQHPNDKHWKAQISSRRRKHIKKTCNTMYNDCSDSNDFTMDTRVSNTKHDYKLHYSGFANKCGEKIGYRLNEVTHNSYMRPSDDVNDTLSRLYNHMFNRRGNYTTDISVFKNLNEYDKLKLLFDVKVHDMYKDGYKDDLISIKKQIKRRGHIGYFKGHDNLNDKYLIDNTENEIM